VIASLAEDPFTGDIVRLKGTATWRRRVGSYRVFFEVDFEARGVDVVEFERRTSTTY
jgi:mRNA-degrading endonuclease RelE of RelBE toxin-antitoxin system